MTFAIFSIPLHPKFNTTMNTTLSFAKFKLDIWLLEQLKNAHYPGLTLMELQERWSLIPNTTCKLSRDTLTHHRMSIKDFLGINIEAPDRKHYRIINPEVLTLDTLANDLLKSIQNYIFLQEYKDISDKIQVEEIETGAHFLPIIGEALRGNFKFDYHISPSEDFLGEIAKWRGKAWIEEKTINK